jgi:ADP-heptose:LPS heptosyltransferase
MRALVVRHSSIGDVIHTLPVLATLHEAGWQVGWVVEPAARELLENHPCLDQLAPAPAARDFSVSAAWAALRPLRRRRYDVALDFGGLWKSAAWARLSGATRVLGYSAAWRREPLSGILLSRGVALPEGAAHVIDKNLALLRHVGIEAVGRREFPLPPTAREAAAVEKALAAAAVTRFAILNPGGGWAGKLWPSSHFGVLARGLRERGLPALVTWGPADTALADEVVAASEGAASRAMPTTLLEYAELARRAELVVAADTGPLHLACAVGAPVVGLYGPTDPARNGPFSADDVVVRRVPSCAPCYRRRCATHAGVMATLTPEEVLEAVDRRLAGGRSTNALAL